LNNVNLIIKIVREKQSEQITVSTVLSIRYSRNILFIFNLFYLYVIYLKIVFSNNLGTVFGKELRYNVTHFIECP